MSLAKKSSARGYPSQENNRRRRHRLWGIYVGLALGGRECFSTRPLAYSESVETEFSPDANASVKYIRCHSGYIAGVPKAMLFTNGAEARKVIEIGNMCEPPTNRDCTTMANG